MKHIDICDIIEQGQGLVGTEVTVCGWVRTSRQSKTIAFAEINDGTSLASLQIVLDKSAFDVNLPTGTAVSVVGVVVLAQDARSVEVNATKLEILGECPSDYPMQKKRHTLEYLRTIPHLRVRTNTFNAMLRLRSRMSGAVHQFFGERNYCWVHTPIITGSDCEGAGEVFRVTTHGWSHTCADEAEYNSSDFFGRRAGLTVSGQLEGEVAAMALGKIYTFGPTFRAELSKTSRHVAEFWQIEPEVAFADLDDIIQVATDMIKYLIRYALEHCSAELAFFERHFQPELTAKLRSVADSDFARIDYTQAIEILRDSAQQFEYPVEWGCDLQTEHERYLTDVHFGRPLFVVNYPKKLKSFYMKQNPDGRTVAATDLLVPGVGEIIGCSQREDNHDKLLQAMTSRGMKLDDYEHYIALRRFGSVVHSGFGLGLERLLMYLSGMTNIRDTILYPRACGELS